MQWKISADHVARMREECIAGFPLEACGLFLGTIDKYGKPTGDIVDIWPAKNAEQSARIYSVDSSDMLHASKYAAEHNLEIVGVYHSHTHTPAYPSPTDIERSVDASWCYAILSLAHDEIEIRFYMLDKAVEDDSEASGSVQEVGCRIIDG